MTAAVDWLVEQTLEEFEDETTETSTLPAAFAQMTADLLTESGFLTAPLVGHSVRRGARISSVDWDDDRGVLTLAAATYVPEGGEVASFDAEVRAIHAWTTESLSNGGRWLPSDDPAVELAEVVSSVADQIDAIRILVLTTATYVGPAPEAPSFGVIPVAAEVWGAERLAALGEQDGESRPAVPVVTFPDVEIVGRNVPVLGPFTSERDYQAYIAVLPGHLLADLYAEHGARLLEMNVRSFLQARNRINKGIQLTLKAEPGRFLAYNNGLSITARAVELNPEGTHVTALRAFQIVNGGQTTASLHHAKYRQSVDLTGVMVQAKITVVADGADSDLAPKVSQFANAQNPVRMADFTANNPFHVALETVAKETATPGGARYWYYERSRGRYADDLAAAADRGEQADFKRRFPPAQKLTKLDVAKLELTWGQRPNVVALGGEKSFAWYMQSLRDSDIRAIPDAEFWRDLAAKALLWRAADRITADLELGGYKAQAVAYTLALLSNRSAQRIDLDAIWSNQAVASELREHIAQLAPVVHAMLVASAGTRNVTEWAKKEECLDAIQEIEWSVPDSLLVEPRARGRRVVARSAPKESLPATALEQANEARIMDYGAEGWFGLSAWAKDTDNFQPWQRGLAFTIGKFVRSGKSPTVKMVRQGLKILDEAERLGYQPQRTGG